MEGMLSSIKINKKRGIELAKSNFSVATDIADLIVKKGNCHSGLHTK